jgi:RNA polymerase-associated protein LEO1
MSLRRCSCRSALDQKAKKREGKQAVEVLFVLNFGRCSGLGAPADTTVDRLAFRRGSVSQKCARRQPWSTSSSQSGHHLNKHFETGMATSGELFGDDSSSDDEDNTAPATIADPPKEEGVPVAADAQEQEESDAVGAKQKDSSPTKSTSNNKPSPKKKPSIMDDDSDDDDDDENEPEFDDAGAVVGSHKKSAHIGATNSRPSNAAPVRRTEDDALKDNDRDEDDEDILKETDDEDDDEEEMGDTRTLIVQESTRPSPHIQSMCITKMPNLVGVQTTAFDEIEYSKRQEDEDYGKAAYNLIRWRYKTNAAGDLVRGDKDGDDALIRESNTRLVEWEDGSYTMHVGEEVFAIEMTNVSQSNGFPGSSGYLYLSSQAASYKEDGTPAGTVLECMGAIGQRMQIKPTSLQSEAHKILTHGIRQKTIKAARIAEFVTQHDPEKEKQARLKMKSDLDKVNNVRKGGNTTGSSSASRQPRMSRRYLNEGEEEEEEDDAYTLNIKKMKRRAMDGGYDDDESEEEEYGDSFRQAKKKKKEESSEDEEMELDDEDEDAPIMASKKKKQTGLFDDSDSD